MHSVVIDPNAVRDLGPLVLDDRGHPRVLPASFYAETTREERALLGLRCGAYGLPTVELVAYLQSIIAGRSALEIGSGNGVLARALDIPATDNRQQDAPDIRKYYEALGQPTIRYGDNVEALDAHAAVARYRPQVVIASWVTHRYDPCRHWAGGNQDGVTEEDIIANCDAYVFIGNESVHRAKSIWAQPHQRWSPPWLYSRAVNGSQDFIAIWERSRK